MNASVQQPSLSELLGNNRACTAEGRREREARQCGWDIRPHFRLHPQGTISLTAELLPTRVHCVLTEGPEFRDRLSLPPIPSQHVHSTARGLGLMELTPSNHKMKRLS